MGYFDAFTANLFRSSRAGQRVFAPFGKFGAVYLVPTDADAARLSAVVRRMYQLMLPGLIGIQIALGWRWNLLFGPVWLVAFWGVLYREARKLPRTDLRAGELAALPRREMQARAGRAMGRGWLVAMLGIAVTFVVMGAWLWLRTREPSMLLATGFFSLCGAVPAYQLIVARGSGPPSPPGA